MHRLLLISLLCCLLIANAQSQPVAQSDSLLKKLNALPVTANDTTRVNLLNALAANYIYNKPDTTYFLAQQAYKLSRSLNYPTGEAGALSDMAYAFIQLGDYAKALKVNNQVKELYLKLNDTSHVASTLSDIAWTYLQQGNWQKGLAKIQESYALYKTIAKPDPSLKTIILAHTGYGLYKLEKLDSARVYLEQALLLVKPTEPTLAAYILSLLGELALAKNNPAQAFSLNQQSLALYRKVDNYGGLTTAYYRLATFYQKTAQTDSCLHYAKLSLEYAQKGASPRAILNSSQLLTQLYEGKNDTQALRYYKIAVAAKDSLSSQDKVKQLLALDFEEQQQAQQIEAAKAEYRSTVRTYIFIGLLVVLGAIALVLYRSNRQKQQANALLQRQRDEIHEQRTKAENTLSTLKATQAQLIQKEKMASLGELTAGIAHEIQNPLNFVNNFSEVSTELVDELREEIKADRKDDALALAEDLSQNLQKIGQHGTRASSIVKGMLEHSRTATGERQPTDLNAVVDEYLRLAYHGARAKNKDRATGTPERDPFNAELKTDFDPNLGLVEAVPQELGRVLLNLFNNAFYAVSEKQKQHPNGYQPIVSVSTKRKNGQIEILVRDNGTGIPDTVKHKIFQPFFTTKPTGEGTGLGLSLAYDIITKGHGGTLAVSNQEGEGTEFVMTLPTN
jgi:signal transduction histidine kinase